MSASNLTCYTSSSNTISSNNQYFPCTSSSDAGAVSCCATGDYCMQNSLCHYTHAITNGTGYYMSGCTDPTWQDPACPKQCTSEYTAEVIYDTANEQWDCCVSDQGYLDCQQPSQFIVEAPAPQGLVVVAHLTQSAPSAVVSEVGTINTASSSSSSSPTESAIASTASQAPVTVTGASQSQASNISSTTAPSGSNGSPGSPGGATAGIVTGVVAGILLLTLLTYFLMRRRQRRQAHLSGYSDIHEMKYDDGKQWCGTYTALRTPSELQLNPPAEVVSFESARDKMPSPGHSPAMFRQTGHESHLSHWSYPANASELAGDVRPAAELPGSR